MFELLAYFSDDLDSRRAGGGTGSRIGDYEVEVRFHSSNVTGWTSLPITFTPGSRTSTRS